MTSGTGVAEELDVYRAAYERQPAPGGEWLRALKSDAFARFSQRGFPTTRDEAWKYTSVSAIVRKAWRDPGTSRPSDARLRQLGFGGAFAGQEVVFVDGRLVPELSTLHPAAGVAVRRLADVMAEGVVAGHLGVIDVPARRTPFADLNTALFSDGVYLEIAAGAVVQAPIHVLHVSTGSAAAASVSYPRTLVVVRRAAQATLVETYGGASGDVYFTNAVTEVCVEDGARLDHVRMQRESESAYHVATLAVRQERGSTYANRNIAVGAALGRLDLDCVLDGEGCDLTLDGLYLADGTQHLDNHTRIEHARPHGTSRELYKGILDGRARGVFHGNVSVRPGAQKTDAQQSNKNLLLSKQALVQSIPQLEIFADDVKCKHGSTTGQLDAAALFYLRSRGLDEQAARSLLTYAFASEITQRIPVLPVRAALEAFLHERLPAAPKEAVA
jgi:Fe-S cluster assembly protein SufD